MRYVFFGTPEFAAIILRKLISGGYPPIALVCNPDRPVGRKKVITPPPTKQLIANGKRHMEVLQPEDLRTIRDKLYAIRPDFFIVAAYANIIPRDVLAIPRLGTIGVHPSLLPRHRGSSPIQTALLAGDTETGVTLYLLDRGVDSGPIVSRATCTVLPGDTYRSLAVKLADLAGTLLLRTLPAFISAGVVLEPQNDAQATHTKKFTTVDAFVDAEELHAAQGGTDPESATRIHRMIRALNPEPGVWTMRNGKRVKLLESALPGGRLVLKVIQEEGQRPKAVNSEQ